MGLGQHIVRVDVHFTAVHGGLGQGGLLLAVVDLAVRACGGVHSHCAVGGHIDLPEAALIVADIGVAILAGQDHIVVELTAAVDLHLLDAGSFSVLDIGQVAMDIHLFRFIRTIFRVFVGHSAVLVEFGTGDGIRAPGRGFCIGSHSGIAPSRCILRQGTRAVAESRRASRESASIVAKGYRVIVVGNGLLAKGQRTAAERLRVFAERNRLLAAAIGSACNGVVSKGKRSRPSCLSSLSKGR